MIGAVDAFEASSRGLLGHRRRATQGYPGLTRAVAGPHLYLYLYFALLNAQNRTKGRSSVLPGRSRVLGRRRHAGIHRGILPWKVESVQGHASNLLRGEGPILTCMSMRQYICSSTVLV
jgi:hypothetical protein